MWLILSDDPFGDDAIGEIKRLFHADKPDPRRLALNRHGLELACRLAREQVLHSAPVKPCFHVKRTVIGVPTRLARCPCKCENLLPIYCTIALLKNSFRYLWQRSSQHARVGSPYLTIAAPLSSCPTGQI